MTVGHPSVPYCQAALFTPRRCWIDSNTGENVKSSEGFYKTVQMDEVNCYEHVVSKWTSLQNVFGQLDQKNRSVVNKLKGLFNSEQLRCILVLHDKQCENYATASNFSKGHFHCLLSSETIKSLSQDPLYRKVYREFNSNGGYCQLSKVSGDATGILKYMYTDKEKFFMRSNCSDMLSRFSEAQNEMAFFDLDIEYGLTGFEQMPFISFTESESTETSEVTQSFKSALELVTVENSTVPSPDVPFSLKNKATEQVNFLMKLLERRTDCSNLNDLLVKFKVGCPEWKAIIAICANAIKRLQTV